VRDEIVEAYGQDLVDLLEDVTSRLRTETLIDLNARTNEGADPARVAGDWLREEGVVQGS
jgi:glycine betaine/choline ABC-type transport system substrate-binding protein